MKFRVLTIFFKFYIRPPISVFLFLTLHLILDGLILFRKDDFRHVRSFLPPVRFVFSFIFSQAACLLHPTKLYQGVKFSYQHFL